VHCVVAAGNGVKKKGEWVGQDAKNRSPARVPTAITVGATEITDARSKDSNYGASVDIFAPGGFILSTTIDKKGDPISWYLSGTSQA